MKFWLITNLESENKMTHYFNKFNCIGILTVLFLSRLLFAAEVSLTFDDFDVSDSLLLTAEERNNRILKVLTDHNNIESTLFVQAKNVESPRGKALLKEWDDRGHAIANHTYSHLSYSSPKVDFNQFSKDLLQAENLIKTATHFEKLFRFPYLHEGNTQEKRDQLRQFLKARHYKIGYVSIDASDWFVNDRLKDRIQKNPKTDLAPYRDYYLAHIWDRATFYNDLSKKVLGREIKHTLLLHYNLLNALFLNDLVEMFQKKGWKVISSNDAFSDPVFQMEPNIVPAGNSILWALAKETGKYDSILRDPGEEGDYEKGPMDKLGL